MCIKVNKKKPKGGDKASHLNFVKEKQKDKVCKNRAKIIRSLIFSSIIFTGTKNSAVAALTKFFLFTNKSSVKFSSHY